MCLGLLECADEDVWPYVHPYMLLNTLTLQSVHLIDPYFQSNVTVTLRSSTYMQWPLILVLLR